MRKLSTGLPAKQSGFTLIELVIVIVIIGILASVAIPQLSSVSVEAERAKGIATLGAVKSAWSGAYAIAKGTPAIANITGLLTGEPSCTGTASPLTCTYPDNTSYTIKYTGLDSPALFSCNKANCDKEAAAAP